MKRERIKYLSLERLGFLFITLISPLIIFGQAHGQTYTDNAHPQGAYQNHSHKNSTYQKSPYKNRSQGNRNLGNRNPGNRNQGNRLPHRPTVILTNPNKVGPPTLLRQLNPRTFSGSSIRPLPSHPSASRLGKKEGVIIEATPLHQPKTPPLRERHFTKGHSKENQIHYQNKPYQDRLHHPSRPYRPYRPYRNGRYGTVERTAGGTIIIRW